MVKEVLACRKLTQGLSWIMAQPDIEKVMLNLEELYDISACSGNTEETRIISGLIDRRENVAILNERLRKGRGITYERLVQAAECEISEG